MSNPRFKLCDRVRATGDLDYLAGEVGVVTKVYSPEVYDVLFPSYGREIRLYNGELNPVPDYVGTLYPPDLHPETDENVLLLVDDDWEFGYWNDLDEVWQRCYHFGPVRPTCWTRQPPKEVSWPTS